MAPRARISRTPRPSHMSPVDIAWLAGIVEGEGWIGHQGTSTVRLAVKMTDKDVIDRIAAVTQSGNVSGPISRNGCKDYWTWNCSRKQEVVRILLAIAPQLGARRKERILSLSSHLGSGRVALRWEPTHA